MSTVKFNTWQNTDGTENYKCRAWVNFDGTTNTGGNCDIRASGNVSSVNDNGTGDYTVNFTTAFSDTNYCVTASSLPQISSSPNLARGATFIGVAGSADDTVESGAVTTSSVTLQSTRGASSIGNAQVIDCGFVNIAIFR